MSPRAANYTTTFPSATKMTKIIELHDQQTLRGAKTCYGNPIPVHDDGYGPLWVFRDAYGIGGIIRAQTWGDAMEIVDDLFMPEADMTIEDLKKEFGFRREHKKVVKAPVVPSDPDYLCAGLRYVRDSDYVNGMLPEKLFSHWKTIETPDPEAWMENELFQEQYGFRPNGPRVEDKHKHGIFYKGFYEIAIDKLSDELQESLGIVLEASNFWEVEVPKVSVNGDGSFTHWPYGGESEEEARKCFEKHAERGDHVILFLNGDVVNRSYYRVEETQEQK